MKTLAFDISVNNTGWSYIKTKNQKIKEYDFGNIQPYSTMKFLQKLYLFGNEITKIIEKYSPDEICFEESVQIFGHGFKTAKTLSRFSGIGLYAAYSYQKKEVFLYEPTLWRTALGLSGACHKTEVQFVISKLLGLLTTEQCNHYEGLILKEYSELEQFKQKIESSILTKTKLGKDKSISKDEKEQLLAEVKTLKSTKTKKIKDNKKKFVKALDAISLDILSDTGIDHNVSDSFGLNFCLLKELKGLDVW